MEKKGDSSTNVSFNAVPFLIANLLFNFFCAPEPDQHQRLCLFSVTSSDLTLVIRPPTLCTHYRTGAWNDVPNTALAR
jgi:hypothetical protein